MNRNCVLCNRPETTTEFRPSINLLLEGTESVVCPPCMMKEAAHVATNYYPTGVKVDLSEWREKLGI